MSANLTEENRGCWVIVDDGASKYIGRVTSLVSTDSEPRTKDMVLDAWTSRSVLRLFPAFEYISRLIPQQTENGVVLARDSAVIPYDITLSDRQVVYVKPNSVVFLEDMSSADYAQYQTLINRCGDMILQSRAAKSGISLSSQMPSPQRSPSKIIR
jgi:hypothetical protein